MEISKGKFTAAMLVSALLGSGATAAGFVATDKDAAPVAVRSASPTVRPTATPRATGSPVLTAAPETPSQVTQADRDTLLRLARSYVAAENVNPAEAQIAVDRVEGDFAVVTVGSGVSGTQFYFKRVDNLWLQIYNGPSAPDANIVQRYGIPSALVSG